MKTYHTIFAGVLALGTILVIAGAVTAQPNTSGLANVTGTVAVPTDVPTDAPTCDVGECVHVCTNEHFNTDNKVCTQDDTTISDLSDTRVQMYSPNNTLFGDEIIVAVDNLDANGQPIPDGVDGSVWLGAFEDYGNGSYSTVSYSLDGVLNQMKPSAVALQAGTTYRLGVLTDNNDGSGPTQVGSFDFTYKPNS